MKYLDVDVYMGWADAELFTPDFSWASLPTKLVDDLERFREDYPTILMGEIVYREWR